MPRHSFDVCHNLNWTSKDIVINALKNEACITFIIIRRLGKECVMDVP